MKKIFTGLYLANIILFIANAKTDNATTESTILNGKKNIYAPWRQQYNQKDKDSSPAKTASCPFCTAIQENKDDVNFVIKRYEHVFVYMNKYPFNSGHLLIIPYEHQSDLSNLPPEVAHELIIATQDVINALKEVCNPEAFNIGINMGLENKLDKGHIAGGSLPNHLHIHVLPRSSGDCGFLPILNNTTVISIDLPTLYQKLKEVLK